MTEQTPAQGPEQGKHRASPDSANWMGAIIIESASQETRQKQILQEISEFID